MLNPAKKKEKKPLNGSHKATPLAALALKPLLKVRAQQEVLKRRARLLKKIIMDQGGGSAHGYRSYTYHVRASVSQRTVRVKAHDELKLVEIAS